MARRAATQLAVAVDCPPNQQTLACRCDHSTNTTGGQVLSFWPIRARSPEKVITTMCTQLTILARHTAACYVAQCEHSTIHLCWEHVSIHLRPLDFLALTHSITELCARQPDHTGKMRLGIGALTLELLPDDYQPMSALMRQVAAQLTPATQLQPLSMPFHEPSKVSFLLN